MVSSSSSVDDLEYSDFVLFISVIKFVNFSLQVTITGASYTGEIGCSWSEDSSAEA